MSEHSEQYIPVHSEKEILKRFMKILKFYNEIIKSSPLIVSDSDIINYKKKKVKNIKEEKKLEEFFKTPYVDMHYELGEINTHSLDEKIYKLNISNDKKTRFNVYILKKINDLETDLQEFSDQLNYFYLKYKKYYDRFTFYNIFASTGVTLIESISLMFNPQVYTGVVTIIISTSVALSTAVLKLKNYKEKIEEIVKTTEKVYSCQSQLFTFDKLLKTSLNMSPEQQEINIDDI
jgi:hypothetical protein